jgi:hypothetical protein
MLNFRFSRRRVWSSESSGMYTRVVKYMSTDVSEVRTASATHRTDDGGSMHLLNFRRNLFGYTAVHPRRLWTSLYSVSYWKSVVKCGNSHSGTRGTVKHKVLFHMYKWQRDGTLVEETNPLRPSGNYMNHMLWQSVMLHFVFIRFVWFSF